MTDHLTPERRRAVSRLGGLARAAKLSAERRREIARLGFQAMVDARFGGDRAAAVAWLVAAGLWWQDEQLAASLRSLGGAGRIVRLADDPGPFPPAREVAPGPPGGARDDEEIPW